MNYATAADTYRAWSNTYYANAFAITSTAETYIALASCPAGNCGGPCETCKFWVDATNLVISPELKVGAQGLEGTVDVTSSFSLGAIELLAQPNLRWTAAAEGTRHLVRGSVGLVAVSDDATAIIGALANLGGQIQPLTRSVGGVGVEALDMTSPPGPPARDEFATVLSATEGSVFVIGGTLRSGGLAEDIWRYDFSWGTWQQLPLQGPAPKNVLAGTFVPDDRSLYFVDERKVGMHQARLVRYDLNTQKVTVLGAWPRTPQIDKVFLTSTDDGTMVLAGTSTTLRYVAGVVLRPDSHNVAIQAGFYRSGALAFAPVLTDEGLTLPLAALAPPGVENAFVPRNELFSQDKPKKGNGKAWGKATPIDFKDVL